MATLAVGLPELNLVRHQTVKRPVLGYEVGVGEQA